MKPGTFPTSAQTHEAILAHKYVGNFYADSKQMGVVSAFAANTANPLAHRADVLRHMAREGMGLEGEQAGNNLTDLALVLEFMQSEL